MSKVRYDLVFGIGSACTCTELLRKAGLQYEAYPLDWVGRSDVRGRTRLVMDGFRDFMDARRLAPEPGEHDDGRHLHLVDGGSGFAFFHDFPVGKSAEESFPAVKAKYDRRISRFFSRLDASRRVLIVWIGETRDQTHVDDDEIRECLGMFSARYPRAKFEMLLLECRLGVLPEDAEVTRGDGFCRIAFDYLSHDPAAPVWQLRDELVLPYLKRRSARDCRSRAERTEARRRDRQAEWARFGAHSRIGCLVAKMKYKALRWMRKRMAGIKLEGRES